MRHVLQFVQILFLIAFVVVDSLVLFSRKELLPATASVAHRLVHCSTLPHHQWVTHLLGVLVAGFLISASPNCFTASLGISLSFVAQVGLGTFSTVGSSVYIACYVAGLLVTFVGIFLSPQLPIFTKSVAAIALWLLESSLLIAVLSRSGILGGVCLPSSTVVVLALAVHNSYITSKPEDFFEDDEVLIRKPGIDAYP